MGASPLDHIPMFAWVYDVMSFLLLFTSLAYFFGLWLYFYRRYFFPVNLLPVVFLYFSDIFSYDFDIYDICLIC